MGGRGSSSAGAGGGSSGVQRNAASPAVSNVDSAVRGSRDYIGDQNVKRQVLDEVTRSMTGDVWFPTVEEFRIVSNPGGGRVGKVEATYRMQVARPFSNPDTGEQDYSVRTVRRTKTFQVRLRWE